MKLTAFCHPPGNWRMPGAHPTDMDFDENVHLARVAERGKFDMLFYQDSAAVAPSFYLSGNNGEALAESARCVRLEPLTMLAALAAVTTHIGLVATATTTYNDPFSLARKFATIDHISKGRGRLEPGHVAERGRGAEFQPRQPSGPCLALSAGAGILRRGHRTLG